jgi:hypothetical protein
MKTKSVGLEKNIKALKRGLKNLKIVNKKRRLVGFEKKIR